MVLCDANIGTVCLINCNNFSERQIPLPKRTLDKDIVQLVEVFLIYRISMHEAWVRPSNVDTTGERR